MNLNPATQINLFEHKEIFNQLCKLSKNDILPNKILLSGEKGIGKSTSHNVPVTGHVHHQ